MRIAVPVEDGKIYDHYGSTRCFKLYDVEDGQIISSELVPTEGRGHFYMVQFMVNHGVGLVLCKSMGSPARSALDIAGISWHLEQEGDPDEAVKAFLGEEQA